MSLTLVFAKPRFASVWIAASSPAPSVEAPRVEAPRVEAPRVEAPRVERAPGKARLACPNDMALVAGDACAEVTQRCLEWLPQPSGSPPRCARFEPNASCN